jgi:AraC-like DNA-binding protein
MSSLKKWTLQEHGIYLYESKHQAGDVVTPHHHDIHQILYAIEGEGTIRIDGRSYEFQQDNAAYLVPYSVHSVVSDSELTLLVLAFDASRLGALLQGERMMQEYLKQSLLLKINPFNGSEMRLFLRKMLYEQYREGQLPLGGLAMQVTLLEILLMLSRSAEPFNAYNANSLRAERIKQYLDTSYYDKITLSDIASKIGVSARHVNNIFKEVYLDTPMQYLTGVRVGLAKKLLAETDKDIVTIGFEVGFDTLSTFYRTFKNSVRMSPKQYRDISRNPPNHRLDPEVSAPPTDHLSANIIDK